jgi:hypothetical protein
MIRYASLGTNDLARAAVFYDAVLLQLGLHSEILPKVIFYSLKGADEEDIVLAITKPYNDEPARAGNGTMIALRAESKTQVNLVHATALAQGGTSEGAPGFRPQYGPRMYVGYFRDLDHNKLSVVYLEPGVSQ